MDKAGVAPKRQRGPLREDIELRERAISKDDGEPGRKNFLKVGEHRGWSPGGKYEVAERELRRVRVERRGGIGASFEFCHSTGLEGERLLLEGEKGREEGKGPNDAGESRKKSVVEKSKGSGTERGLGGNGRREKSEPGRSCRKKGGREGKERRRVVDVMLGAEGPGGKGKGIEKKKRGGGKGENAPQ